MARPRTTACCPSPLGKRLRRLRERLGMSPGLLAERAGVSPGVVYSLEDGSSQFLLPATARRIAKALRVDWQTLME